MRVWLRIAGWPEALAEGRNQHYPGQGADRGCGNTSNDP